MSRAIVVGGSRGIGLAIAHKFLKHEIAVTLISRNETNLQNALNHLENSRIDSSKAALDYQICDVSNENDIEKCCQQLFSSGEKADILVNSAGITLNKLLLGTSRPEMENIFNTNLLGTIHLTKLISKSMIRNKKGAIINIGSVIGTNGNVGQTIYSASKSGLIGFTKSLAKELGPKGICVNLVSPGFIDTEMTEKMNESRLKEIIKLIPAGRIGNADEVANVVHFLACDSAFITGHVLLVDGGLALTI